MALDVSDGVSVNVGVAEGVSVWVGEGVSVGVRVALGVDVDVTLAVGVGVGGARTCSAVQAGRDSPARRVKEMMWKNRILRITIILTDVTISTYMFLGWTTEVVTTNQALQTR